MKLRQKFFLIFVLISVIPVLVVSMYTYSRYTRLIDQQISMSTENLMNTASGSINQILQNIEHITEAMYLPRTEHEAIVDLLPKYSGAHTPTTLEIYQDNEKLGYACQDFFNFYSYINGIFIFTPSGKTLGYAYGSNVNVWKDYSSKEDAWYQDTLNLAGDIYLYGRKEKPFFQSATDSVSFCTALSDVRTREFLGVLMVDCKPEVFDLTSVNTMPELAILTVTDQEELLYETKADQTLEEDPINS
ncbi:MAG: cache domain-containing protein, partial [Eubacteriales bacterium]|nr:cache domain-containing protein [Eubacteriales bacterium]